MFCCGFIKDSELHISFIILDLNILQVILYCDVVGITTTQLFSGKPELWFSAGSKPACGVSEICDGENL